MRTIMIKLIGISFLQSLLSLLFQDERSAKVLKLIGGIAMATVLLSGVSQFDYHAYAAALLRERIDVDWDADAIREQTESLNRRYIESRCAAYILERASQLELPVKDAAVTLAWSTEGYWYPVHAEMTVPDGGMDYTQLKRLLECELGIPAAEQIWRGG